MDINYYGDLIRDLNYKYGGLKYEEFSDDDKVIFKECARQYIDYFDSILQRVEEWEAYCGKIEANKSVLN